MRNMLRSAVSYSLIFVLPFFIFSCTQKEKPVTKEEAATLAKAIEASVVSGDESFLDGIIDEKSFADRVVKDKKSSFKRGVSEGIKKGLQSTRLGRQIIDAAEKNGSYQLVKQYEKDQKQHLIFRLYTDGALNYHDFELIRVKDKVKASDVYIYITGDWLSANIADVMGALEDNISAAEIDKISSMKSIKTKTAMGQYEEAKKQIDELPEKVRNQKLLQVMNMQIASQLSPEIYKKAVEEYQVLFPNEPNMYLSMIDYYFSQKDYTQVLNCIDKIDSMINKDPMLDYQRALVYKTMEDTTKMGQTLERLNKTMPDFLPGNTELIDHYVNTNQLEKAKPLLEKYIKNKKASKPLISLWYLNRPELEKIVPQP